MFSSQLKDGRQLLPLEGLIQLLELLMILGLQLDVVAELVVLLLQILLLDVHG